MENSIKKIECLLKATKAPLNSKNAILHLAKRAKDFGYKQTEIITALEMWLDLQNGAGMTLVALPGTGYNKGAASFFVEHILPILFYRRCNNFTIRINNRNVTTLNLN